MEFAAGFLIAVAMLLSPWTRGGGMHVECVGRPECERVSGIKDIFERESEVNLILVHGMGAGPETDYTEFTDELARHLGLFHLRSADENIPGNPAGTAPARLFTRTYSSPARDKILDVYELHWWYLIQNSKSRLVADERHYPGRRARFNRGLKSHLVNDRIADPIIYLGPLGEAIRNSVEYTVCRASQGTPTSAGCANWRSGQASVIVTESLGSEIVFSVLSEQAAVSRELFEKTPQVFMLANQLPLLGLARAPGEGIEPLELLSSPSRESEGVRRQVVAISDPSDLLSYPIPESISQDGTVFINVLRPFGRRLLLGQVVDPLGAHTRAKEDERIAKMIACGFPTACVPRPAANRR